MGWDGKARFSREVPQSDPREIWADGGKWEAFFETIKKAKADGAHTLVIDCPQALGDTYRELVLMLSTIAGAGLTLEISGVAGQVVTSSVDFKDGKEVEVASKGFFETRKGPGPVPPDAKANGPFLLRPGREPFVMLSSVGPDELYCQAELLLLAEQEVFKPASKGRAIYGAYAIAPASLECFLEQHPQKEEQAVMELHREEIKKRGWSYFCATEKLNTELEAARKEMKAVLKGIPKQFHGDWEVQAAKAKLKKLGDIQI